MIDFSHILTIFLTTQSVTVLTENLAKVTIKNKSQ